MSTLVFVGPNCTRDVPEVCRHFTDVYLFEPLPDACEKLRETIPKANIIEAACAAKEGKAKLRTYNRQGMSSSLFEVSDQARDKFDFVDWDDSTEIEVETINLGTWLDENGIEKIETLIIDAQGMDLEILKTLEARLKQKTIRLIQTECDDQGFQHYNESDNSLKSQREFMEPLGYRPMLSTRTVTFHPDVIWQPLNC